MAILHICFNYILYNFNSNVKKNLFTYVKVAVKMQLFAFLFNIEKNLVVLLKQLFYAFFLLSELAKIHNQFFTIAQQIVGCWWFSATKKQKQKQKMENNTGCRLKDMTIIGSHCCIVIWFQLQLGVQLCALQCMCIIDSIVKKCS